MSSIFVIFRLLGVGLLVIFVFTPAVQAQDRSEADDGLITINFPNMPIPVILNEYERLTGKRVIRDASVLGASLNLETTHPLTKEEAARFLEKSLLLNGFALLPSGPDDVKIVGMGGASKPVSEGVPVIVREEDLPDSDEIVTFVMPFEHLSPDEAAKTLSQVVPIHAYGAITPFVQGAAVAITENSAAIHKMIELREFIDVPPSKIEQRAVQLERGDATEVAEAMIALLGLDGGDSAGSGGGGNILQTQGEEGQPIPHQGNAAQVDAPAAAGAGRPNGSVTQSIQPRIQALARTNRILIVGRPVDIAFIESMIEHFDAPPELSMFMQRTLNYMPVSNFLPIASDALLRGLGGEDAQQGQISGGGATSSPGGLTGNTSSFGGVGGNVGQSSGFGQTGFGSTT
ncbi:MAG: secretin N-terminal domain-containing protein [Verrucomicrobiota bacterium]